jgi:oxygen-dependent protoporphyrinogen oxidase
LDREDTVLIEIVRAELQATAGIVAEPALARVTRWPAAMPQYTIGHLERLTAMDRRLAALPGLFLAGAAYRGVGIPDCIQSGEAAAGRAADFIAARR